MSYAVSARWNVRYKAEEVRDNSIREDECATVVGNIGRPSLRDLCKAGRYPALKRWVIVGRPLGTAEAHTTRDKQARQKFKKISAHNAINAIYAIKEINAINAHNAINAINAHNAHNAHNALTGNGRREKLGAYED